MIFGLLLGNTVLFVIIGLSELKMLYDFVALFKCTWFTQPPNTRPELVLLVEGTNLVGLTQKTTLDRLTLHYALILNTRTVHHWHSDKKNTETNDLNYFFFKSVMPIIKKI